jgi:hypothetical protein
VLNRQLPEITARDVLPHRPVEIVCPREVPTNLTRVETFAGAACLRRFPVMHALETNTQGVHLARSKAAPLQARLASITAGPG